MVEIVKVPNVHSSWAPVPISTTCLSGSRSLDLNRMVRYSVHGKRVWLKLGQVDPVDDHFV